MFEAIVAGIITLIVVLCLVIVIFYIRSRKQDRTNVYADSVKQLDTVGVGTSPLGSGVGKHARIVDGVRVKSEKESMRKPSDSLSRRFAIFGVFIAGVFATLGAKLWSMQLLSNASYATEAESNLYTTVNTPAPRGCIYDRNGLVLVKNRLSETVLADADVARDEDVLMRLQATLGIPIGVLRDRVKDESLGAQSQRIIASDVRLRDVAFISEHSDAFPGISIEERTVREYPYGALAAHVLGYIGSPTQEELESQREGRNLESFEYIGKNGVELTYDSILAGDKGVKRMMVDASGKIINVVSETDAVKGSDVYLSIDAHAQYVADKLLARQIAPKGDIGTGRGVTGVVVAMNVQDGGIAVMANYPTFDPTLFTNGIPQDVWELYNSDESHSPLLNRAVNGQFAPASTIKAFTSMAGLHYGFANYSKLWNCTGKWDGFGSGDVQMCWERDGHGTLDLHGGIVNSCDVVFYDIAKEFYDAGPDGRKEISETAIQEYLEQYNFGSPTGIDLASEAVGRLPTPAWKAEQWRNVPSEAFWRGGDYTNMIIGQGDLLITPIQLACAYGAIATGKVLKPHLMKEVMNGSGEVVYEAATEVTAEPDVNLDHLQYVRNSLHDVVRSNDDLSEILEAKGVDAAGKSGTAEHSDRGDDAWFAVYGPFNDPKYVVVCIIEGGGGGSAVAGPIACEVLGTLFESDGENPNQEVGYIEGSSGKSKEVAVAGNSGRQD